MENSDDQFQLKWNNFQSNLATGFHDLLQEEDMVDVTLAAEGKFLQAHKIILSVCSPYFKDLFKVNPCKHPIVILKDVGHQELADMLDFMYRGEASVRQEDLAAFLKLAETLKVKGLAGDKTGNEETNFAQKKPSAIMPKKKKVIEATVFEPDDDPGDPDFSPVVTGEPKRKRKRASSPPKTDNLSPSATNNSFVPLANPKQEIPDQDDVEFLDEAQNDPLVQYITGKTSKQELDGSNFEDSNLDLTAGDDETHDGDMSAGPSNIDDSTDQVPQGEERPGKFMVHTPIWDFFVKTTLPSGDVRAVCRVCNKSVRYHNTSVMVRHLRLLHPVAYDNYRNEFLQGRKAVGYDTRGGILGLPLTPPKMPKRAKKQRASESKQYKGVKRLLLLKAQTSKEETRALTDEDVEALQLRNMKIINISSKGVVSKSLLKDDGQEEQEEQEEDVSEQEQVASEEYNVVQLPAEVIQYLKDETHKSIEYEYRVEADDGTTKVLEMVNKDLVQIWDEEKGDFVNHPAQAQALIMCATQEEGEETMEVVIGN